MPTATVYEPFRAGLPPLAAYARSVLARRAFALELARTELRAQHVNTVFGQLWLLINPLILAAVYFVLVDILSGGERGEGYFAHLVACLFLFAFVQQSLQLGVRSVVGAGQLVLNSSFPRVLLPVASVATAFMRLLPMLAVYGVLHVAVGLPLTAADLWVVAILAATVLLAAGLTMALAAANVYFRDLRDALPFALRAWLYASPVLYVADDVPAALAPLLVLNPMAPLLAAWSDVLGSGSPPGALDLALGAAWAAGLFVAGTLFFVSREREFAVRL